MHRCRRSERAMNTAMPNESSDVVDIAASRAVRGWASSTNSPAAKAMAPAPMAVMAEARPKAVPAKPAWIDSTRPLAAGIVNPLPSPTHMQGPKNASG